MWALSIVVSHHFQLFPVATMTWLTVTSYLWHKWQHICFVCRVRNPVHSSCMNYHRVCKEYHNGCYQWSRPCSPFRGTGVIPLFIEFYDARSFFQKTEDTRHRMKTINTNKTSTWWATNIVNILVVKVMHNFQQVYLKEYWQQTYCSIQFHILLGIDYKIILKIQTGESETVSLRRIGNTNGNRKRTKVQHWSTNTT